MADSHRDLIVWQRAVQLSVALYRLTATFPSDEIFGLSSQLRRAGVSVASNIAESWGRQAQGDHKRFLEMARGANLEVQTQLVIATELGFGTLEKRRAAEILSNEVNKILVALLNKGI